MGILWVEPSYTVRTDAVRELCLGVPLHVGFNFLPMAMSVVDAFARGADGQHPAQDFDFGEPGGEFGLGISKFFLEPLAVDEQEGHAHAHFAKDGPQHVRRMEAGSFEKAGLGMPAPQGGPDEHDDGKRHFGPMAQDVEKLDPKAVKSIGGIKHIKTDKLASIFGKKAA